MTKVPKKALKTIALLRRMPKGRLVATAGLGLALFSYATQGHSVYRPDNPNERRRP